MIQRKFARQVATPVLLPTPLIATTLRTSWCAARRAGAPERGRRYMDVLDFPHMIRRRRPKRVLRNEQPAVGVIRGGLLATSGSVEGAIGLTFVETPQPCVPFDDNRSLFRCILKCMTFTREMDATGTRTSCRHAGRGQAAQRSGKSLPDEIRTLSSAGCMSLIDRSHARTRNAMPH